MEKRYTRQFTQPQLIGGLLIWLDEHGFPPITRALLSVLATAADQIITVVDEECDRITESP